jgi:hypothetical protein
MIDINPTAIAEERYPLHTEPDAIIGVTPWQLTRIAYAACIRERELPLRERIAELEARLAILEGKGEGKWNAHTDLPWRTDSVGTKVKGCGDVLGMDVIASLSPAINYTRGMTRQTANAAFIVHACNSYYPTQARLRSLTAAAQVAADSLEWQKKITADLNDEGMHIESEFLYTAISTLSKEGITPGGG